AIVMHRMWKQLGLTMNTFLAWFITFNFINITWIFFRAKDWDQASNILQGMGYGDIIVSDKFEIPLGMLKNIGIEFGQFMIHLGGSTSTWIWILCATLLMLTTPNSTKLTQKFKPSTITLGMTIVLCVDALIHLSKNSEFLYFNF
ncbi:MAG: MBOAT family protein, partial [Sulfuricurvum sp.]